MKGGLLQCSASRSIFGLCPLISHSTSALLGCDKDVPRQGMELYHSQLRTVIIFICWVICKKQAKVWPPETWVEVDISSFLSLWSWLDPGSSLHTCAPSLGECNMSRDSISWGCSDNQMLCEGFSNRRKLGFVMVIARWLLQGRLQSEAGGRSSSPWEAIFWLWPCQLSGLLRLGEQVELQCPLGRPLWVAKENWVKEYCWGGPSKDGLILHTQHRELD